MATVTIKIKLVREGFTKRYTKYATDPSDILTSTVYVATDALRQRFHGETPETLTITITGPESAS